MELKGIIFTERKRERLRRHVAEKGEKEAGAKNCGERCAVCRWILGLNSK